MDCLAKGTDELNIEIFHEEYFHDVVSYKEAIEKGLILSEYCIHNEDINPWICFVQNIDKYTDYKVQAYCERISASAACGGLRGLGVG